MKKEQLPVKYCWNCEKIFDEYEIEVGGETITEDQFCSDECRQEWTSDNKYEKS